MSSPTFVNAGAVNQVSSSTVTPALPSSRVNGNLLLAWNRQIGTGFPATLSVSAGWAICATLGQNDSGNRPMILAYAYVTGSEAAPVFTDSVGSTILNAQVLQYTGVIASGVASPIGGVASNNINNGTTVTCPAFTATSANALAVNIACANISTGLSTPAGWNLETNDSGTSGESYVSDLVIATAGSLVGPTSIAVVTSNYTNFIIEIRSQLAVPLFASQQLVLY